ncbi:MAG: cation-translocating P-type ATPase [Oscillospiraceae bacterium]|nr:cation-translocating P-type ATPase [Oscillospiraceae bacterium]
MNSYTREIEDVLAETGSSREGLSPETAAKKLVENGKNKLAEGKKDSLIKRFFQQMADPMIIILLVAAAVSAAIAIFEGGEGFADVIIILFVVVVNAVLGVYQENKAEKALEALQEMAAATSKVLRGGKIVVIKSEDLVVGDVIILEAGDAVPADGRVIESNSLKIEEAALTGESVPVDKFINILYLEDGAKEVPLGDRKNMVYMGSTVVYGRGMAVVTETGMDTEMGKIAGALAAAEDGLTPLQIKLAQLSKILTWLVLGICVVIFAIGLIRAGSFEFDTILSSFMIAVSLAVAAIPEGLVAVVTIVLSIGVTNMSRRNAIIRKLTAVETLGCAQIICSDKTGTLTQNKMTVVEHFGCDEKLLAEGFALCCDAELNEDGTVRGEPTENALVYWADKIGLPKPKLKEASPRIGEAPFDSSRKMMSTVHETAAGILQYTKGAPDEILRLCTGYLDENGAIQPMTDAKRDEILRANKSMADKALRVLACASRKYEKAPTEFSPAALEENLCFMGLCGMIDPIRPEVKAAIVECRTAGIRPIMITGDHIDTATAIARELGILEEGDRAITGSELNNMSDEEFESRFRDFSVYARVQPEHKVRIVNAWRGAGFITAMTGDGVNDAPSIKSADIGVGMGITGTDVTKNVADMVLADDNFATIVGAVEEGRRIYDNIRKAIQFLLSSNMSEVISIFVATMFGFIILEPIHLLWINLVTDCFPALALGMEKAESDIMLRRPRSSSEGVFAGGVGVDVAYQGIAVSILTLAAYFVGHYIESGVWEITNSADGMTMAFVTMSMAEIFHSLNMRSQRGSIFKLKTSNTFLYGAAVVSLLLTAALLYIPFLNNAFGLEHINAMEFVIALGMAALMIPIVEIVKFFQRKAAKSR